jgi:predicted nucleotidyltransferase
MHLDDAHRAEAVRILRAYLPPNTQVLAFGSRVHGHNLKPFSDLDLCIKAVDPLPPALLSGLKAALEDSALPFKVDLAEWHTMTPEFRNRIAADLTPFA